MKNILISILLLLLFLAVLFLLRDLPVVKPPAKTPTTNKLSVKKFHITTPKHADTYRIDISYPQITGMANTKTQSSINAAIKKQMNQNIARFQGEVQTTEGSDLPKPFANFVNEFYTNYEFARLDNEIVSIRFTIMDFQAGMDHPNNYDQVFNYDVRANKELQLSDIFEKNTNYLAKLSALTKQQLSERFKDNPYATDFIRQGTKPDAKNFQLFNISQNYFIVTFNPYQVAPYYAGAQTVRIPLTQLKDVLK